MDYLYFLSYRFEDSSSEYAFTLYDPTPELERVMLNIYIYYITQKRGMDLYVIKRISVDGHCIDEIDFGVQSRPNQRVLFRCKSDIPGLYADTTGQEYEPFTIGLVPALNDHDHETYRLMTEGNREKVYSREDWTLMMRTALPERLIDFYNRCVTVEVTPNTETENNKNYSPSLFSGDESIVFGIQEALNIVSLLRVHGATILEDKGPVPVRFVLPIDRRANKERALEGFNSIMHIAAPDLFNVQIVDDTIVLERNKDYVTHLNPEEWTKQLISRTKECWPNLI